MPFKVEPWKVRRYIRAGIFRIDEVLPFLGNNKKEYLGYMINMSSLRYKLFLKKGIVCINCKVQGKYFALEKNGSNNWHFNLYTFVEKGSHEKMMTRDHIIPKSKGGKDIMENFQVMCTTCNRKKGNKMPKEAKDEI